MIHIRANNGDFFIEETKILSISHVLQNTAVRALTEEGVKNIFYLLIETLEGEFYIEGDYSYLENIRARTLKDIKEIWQSR